MPPRLIPAGVNGAEERMSVVWERCGGAGDPARFVALTSANAAKIFNMYPRKGRIEVGAEADVVVWNPNAAKKITKDEHQSKVDFNVFEGKTVHGVAEHVICQGKVMIDEGHIRVMQGFGRFEPLAPFCPHVYSAVKAREEADAAPRGIERSEEDMAITNGGSEGEIPPMHKPPVSLITKLGGAGVRLGDYIFVCALRQSAQCKGNMFNLLTQKSPDLLPTFWSLLISFT